MAVCFKSRVDLDTSTDHALSGGQVSLPAVPNVISKQWDIPLSPDVVSASDTTFQ